MFSIIHIDEKTIVVPTRTSIQLNIVVDSFDIEPFIFSTIDQVKTYMSESLGWDDVVIEDVVDWSKID